MIKASELRIGNTVHHEYGTSFVTMLRGNDIGLKDCGGAMWSTVIDRVSGIELTPEWLDRFGVEWDIYWQGYTDGNWVLTEGDEDGDWRIAYGKRRNDIIVWDIKYIHQLQNLFFALTGRELELKK